MAPRLPRRRRATALEKLLEAARPEAPAPFLRGVGLFVDDNAPRSSRTSVAARTTVLTAAVIGGLATFGGLGYAKSVTTRIVVRIESHSTYAKQSSLTQARSNAAIDQYGSPTDGVVSTAAHSGSAGAIVAIVPGTSEQTTVKWTPGSFAAPVNVTVDPTASTTLQLDGTNNQVVQVVITSMDGQVQHQLAAPIEIVFHSPPAGYVPAVSQDGETFRALTLLAGPPLPDALNDGYYISGNGDIHVMTRHVTYFAVVSPTNIAISASGKRDSAPHSGLFGDPTLNPPGPPALHQIGGVKITRLGHDITRVDVGFRLNSQANLTLAVVDAAGNLVPLGRSSLDGHALPAGAHGLKIQILKPGTLSLALDALATGTSAQTDELKLAAVDFDGLKTTRTVTFEVPAVATSAPAQTTPAPATTFPTATTPASPTHTPHPRTAPVAPPPTHVSRWSRWWHDIRTAPHRAWHAIPTSPSRWWWVAIAGLLALTLVLSGVAARSRRAHSTD